MPLTEKYTIKFFQEKANLYYETTLEKGHNIQLYTVKYGSQTFLVFQAHLNFIKSGHEWIPPPPSFLLHKHAFLYIDIYQVLITQTYTISLYTDLG